ncbi:MAG: DUF5082 family protein [Lachnotalea sp.]
MSIESLYDEQSRAYDKKDGYEDKRSDVKAKISRLKSALSKVSSIKHQVSKKRSEASRLAHVDKWKGNKFNEYQEEINDSLMNGFNIYYDKTDDISDKIRSKITRLENESSELKGLIGEAWNLINDIATAIINFID